MWGRRWRSWGLGWRWYMDDDMMRYLMGWMWGRFYILNKWYNMRRVRQVRYTRIGVAAGNKQWMRTGFCFELYYIIGICSLFQLSTADWWRRVRDAAFLFWIEKTCQKYKLLTRETCGKSFMINFIFYSFNGFIYSNICCCSILLVNEFHDQCQINITWVCGGEGV